jgi:CRISPR-associated protein Csm2
MSSQQTTGEKINYYDSDGNIKAALFSDEAKALAESFYKKDDRGRPTKDTPKNSQVRKFYNEVLNLQNSINLEIGSDNSDAKKNAALNKWLPFVRMLAAKVDYSKSREKVNVPFEQFIKKHTASIKTYKDFETFVKFFEAVIAYSTGILPKG